MCRGVGWWVQDIESPYLNIHVCISCVMMFVVHVALLAIGSVRSNGIISVASGLEEQVANPRASGFVKFVEPACANEI